MKTLAVFTKYWEPGRVKTRLARAISDVMAARMHRLFLETTLTRLDSLGDERTIVFAPFDRGKEFKPLVGKLWRLVPQIQGSLGARMEAHVAAETKRGAEKIILLGADCPHFSREAVEQAFEQLDNHDAVLGPTDDGGYWLLGVKRVLPIFSGVPWGTAGVWQATINRLESHDLSHFVLPQDYDIDELEDLNRLRRDIRERFLNDSDLQSLGRAMMRTWDGG